MELYILNFRRAWHHMDVFYLEFYISSFGESWFHRNPLLYVELYWSLNCVPAGISRCFFSWDLYQNLALCWYHLNTLCKALYWVSANSNTISNNLWYRLDALFVWKFIGLRGRYWYRLDTFLMIFVSTISRMVISSRLRLLLFVLLSISDLMSSNIILSLLSCDNFIGLRIGFRSF